MRKGILVALMVISTVALADDAREQANVYDYALGWLKPLPDATVDEQVTALIKRHMANLLYPVDMSSLSRPDNDPKFRDLIKVLQQQMGVLSTGVLTVDQFDRLTDASRYIDGEMIGFQPGKIVSMSGNLVIAAGTGTPSGDPFTTSVTKDVGSPINFVRIVCRKERGTCEINDATYNQEKRFLYLDQSSEYEIDTWTPSRVTAKINSLCATSLMTMDIKGEQVSIVTVPQPNSSLCAGAPRESPSTWKLLDGFPVAWKLNQEKMNKARLLVYPPARRLIPEQE